MDENKPVIIPFGKYKGKPIEILMQDEQYANWLKDQSWFREKFSNHYTLIVNNFSTEPVDTADHNAMQVKYISADYRMKVAYAVMGDTLFKYNQSHIDEMLPELLKEFEGDVRSHQTLQKKLTTLNGLSFAYISGVKFEHKGVDVVYKVEYGYGKIGSNGHENYKVKQAVETLWKCNTYRTFRIELKPTIGDDFPQVLRQVKANGSNVIILKEYTGTGATYDEFKKFFESQGLIVLKQSEVEAIATPEFDKVISMEKYF
ncbi:hypothetical protein JWG39_13690 [Desulforhopalus vacuolatus]|uniref:hypothetical protein n=1 Tax=Desulforhopalus vacuolatus TaxID=40414 RepID=UPI0019661C3C|nr:hypothetical protein [Desulforhopalus vacuolatus]MBM9520868.1 hypothetical protein [Desulforhopalus vacuolatus]